MPERNSGLPEADSLPGKTPSIAAQQRRNQKVKVLPSVRGKDLEQCTAIIPGLNDERLQQVTKSQPFGRETRRRISQSCTAISFPLQRLGF